MTTSAACSQEGCTFSWWMRKWLKWNKRDGGTIFGKHCKLFFPGESRCRFSLLGETSELWSLRCIAKFVHSCSAVTWSFILLYFNANIPPHCSTCALYCCVSEGGKEEQGLIVWHRKSKSLQANGCGMLFGVAPHCVIVLLWTHSESSCASRRRVC